MSQQQIQGKIQTRMALLIFCKGVANPMVLYFENAQKVYDELREVINSTEPRLIDFEPLGPIKKATIPSDMIVSIALQEERYITQE